MNHRFLADPGYDYYMLFTHHIATLFLLGEAPALCLHDRGGQLTRMRCVSAACCRVASLPLFVYVHMETCSACGRLVGTRPQPLRGVGCECVRFCADPLPQPAATT